MRQRCAALLLGLLAGCLTGEPVRTTAWLDRLRPFHGPDGGDVVQMDVAVIECPLGDRYINQDLWELTDEQVIAVERRAVLEDNGFRVGQVGGIPPAGLQELLTSERTCVSPHRHQIHADHPKALTVGPVQPVCRFTLHQGGRDQVVTFREAQCALEVVPSLTKDGRTRLRFTPQVQYGERLLMPQPAPDRSGWVRQEQKPTETYPGLSWDVSLAANEYVIVGTRYDRPDTLGYQCFLRAEEPGPVQRLLVIRTGRPAPSVETAAQPGEGGTEPSFSGAPPLALQAAWTSARGAGP